MTWWMVALLLPGLYLFLICPRFPRKSRWPAGVFQYDYAHRGLYGGSIPENSLQAFERAVERGYGIELDLHLTRDGELIVMHDATLTRMCGVKRRISEMTVGEIRHYKLAGSSESVPTFAEALNCIKGRVPLIIELKSAGKRNAELAQKTIERCDKIYLDFGADPHVEGVGDPEAIAQIRRRAIGAGLKLVDCPIRHLGTEKAQEIYGRIQQHLLDAGVTILFEHECVDLMVEESPAGGRRCTGAFVRGLHGGNAQTLKAKAVVVATGRRGASWLASTCEAHGISHEPGPMDMGVRVEVRNEVMNDVNNVLYESKLVGYPNPFRDKVRTFCQNPGGFVSQENYDDGLAVVNGHSYKDRKSNNTNLAVLCTQHFQEPFDRPIAYAQRVGTLMNMLGAGRILVQRFGDVLDGKRTWRKELSRSNVLPTLPDAEPGDITSAMPYRAMTDIVEFIKAVDQVVPGFAASETLLYAPELKFYSNRVRMTERFETNVAHLHCLGDSSGWTRGLMMASVMGLLMGERLD